MKPYNLLYKGEEEKMSYARGEKRLERSEWDCFTIFRLSLFLSARYTLGVISELEYPYKKWIKVEGMGFEPTNP